MNLLELVLEILGIYNFVIFITGTFTNLLAFYICLRKKLRASTTFILFSFLFTADIISLWSWGPNNFMYAFTSSKLKKNVWLCQLLRSLEYFSLEWSSWILVRICS